MQKMTWEEMCQAVVIDGRPGDVASAALGWTELLKNLGSVKESLETNVKDLGTVWKGQAYESFKTRIDDLAKDAGRLIDGAEKHDGIVLALNNVANDLTDAQRAFPVPATCVNDVLEARNAKLTLGVGFFEAKIAPDFLGWADPIHAVTDWINDRSKEAEQVFAKVENDYQSQAATMPGETTPISRTDTNPVIPDIDDGGGTGKLPNSAKLPTDMGGIDDSVDKIAPPDLRTTPPDLRTTRPIPRSAGPTCLPPRLPRRLTLAPATTPDSGATPPGTAPCRAPAASTDSTAPGWPAPALRPSAAGSGPVGCPAPPGWAVVPASRAAVRGRARSRAVGRSAARSRRRCHR